MKTNFTSKVTVNEFNSVIISNVAEGRTFEEAINNEFNKLIELTTDLKNTDKLLIGIKQAHCLHLLELSEDEYNNYMDNQIIDDEDGYYEEEIEFNYAIEDSVDANYFDCCYDIDDVINTFIATFEVYVNCDNDVYGITLMRQLASIYISLTNKDELNTEENLNKYFEILKID